jgi:hypothetical protein
MPVLSEPRTEIFEQSAADAAGKLTRANGYALDFMMGAQKMVLEEMVFAANEMLERAQTETHLFSEFVANENGRIAFGQGSEDDVHGMRPAPDRLCPSRQRTAF